jgi:hypothetical protein
VAGKGKVEFIKTVRTPRATAQYAWLKRPDTQFGDPMFKITMFFDKNDTEFKIWLKQWKEIAKERGLKAAAVPIKLANEQVAEKTGAAVGTPYMEFKTKVTDRNENGIPVFDARGRESTKDVWSGDIVRAEVGIAEWETAGKKGLKGYLNAVQLLKSNNKGPQAGGTFGVDDEYADLTDEEAGDSFSEDDLEDEQPLDEEASTDSTDADDDDPTAGLL